MAKYITMEFGAGFSAAVTLVFGLFLSTRAVRDWFGVSCHALYTDVSDE